MFFKKLPLSLVYPKLFEKLTGCVNFNARHSLMAVYSALKCRFTVIINTKLMQIEGSYINKTMIG